CYVTAGDGRDVCGLTRNGRRYQNSQRRDAARDRARGIRHNDAIVAGLSWLYVGQLKSSACGPGQVCIGMLPLISERGAPGGGDDKGRTIARNDRGIRGLAGDGWRNEDGELSDRTGCDARNVARCNAIPARL